MVNKQITLHDVEGLRDVTPKRQRFSDFPIVNAKDNGEYVISTKFPSIDRLFEEETKINTRGGPYGPFQFISDPAEISTALAWQESRANLIFLRDMLECSIALDFNLREAGVYTELGQAEHNAKASHDGPAIELLSTKCAQAIQSLPWYHSCEAICAVPPSPEKEWDLPTAIAARVSQLTGIKNISDKVKFGNAKQSVKSVALCDKWACLEAGNLSVAGGISAKRIILLDDKYQSGTTAQFVASKLYNTAVDEIYGLFCVKTWRDTDNS
jgi:predicted amidophosphoribosyltransferase